MKIKYVKKGRVDERLSDENTRREEKNKNKKIRNMKCQKKIEKKKGSIHTTVRTIIL